MEPFNPPAPPPKGYVPGAATKCFGVLWGKALEKSFPGALGRILHMRTGALKITLYVGATQTLPFLNPWWESLPFVLVLRLSQLGTNINTEHSSFFLKKRIQMNPKPGFLIGSREYYVVARWPKNSDFFVSKSKKFLQMNSLPFFRRGGWFPRKHWRCFPYFFFLSQKKNSKFFISKSEISLKSEFLAPFFTGEFMGEFFLQNIIFRVPYFLGVPENFFQFFSNSPPAKIIIFFQFKKIPAYLDSRPKN